VAGSLESAIDEPALAGSQDLSPLVTHEDDDPGGIRTLLLFHGVEKQYEVLHVGRHCEVFRKIRQIVKGLWLRRKSFMVFLRRWILLLIVCLCAMKETVPGKFVSKLTAISPKTERGSTVGMRAAAMIFSFLTPRTFLSNRRLLWVWSSASWVISLVLVTVMTRAVQESLTLLTQAQ
jgi:hypothetical protein